MRRATLFLGIGLILCAFTALFGHAAGVSAIGTPSDNLTAPDFSGDDGAQVEIEPTVEYDLVGPTLQTENTPPNIIPSFIGPSEGNNLTVTGQESWYLQIDINAPGWLYIYEYFKTGDEFSGRWIAYKWQLSQSGLWELGPFTATPDEPEGEHIYRFWFYSDGHWAGEGSDTSQNMLIDWTYSKGPPAEQPAAPPAGQVQPPAKEASFLDRLVDFISKQAVLILVILLVIAIIIVGLFAYRRYTRRDRVQNSASIAAEGEPENADAALPSAFANARITLPNGIELQLDGSSRVIGRGDLARALDLDTLGLISRQHFKINREGEQFYIEDLGSANGTRLNGMDISGKGAVTLNAGDIIAPAGAIDLTFSFFNPPQANS